MQFCRSFWYWRDNSWTLRMKRTTIRRRTRSRRRRGTRLRSERRRRILPSEKRGNSSQIDGSSMNRRWSSLWREAQDASIWSSDCWGVSSAGWWRPHRLPVSCSAFHSDIRRDDVGEFRHRWLLPSHRFVGNFASLLVFSPIQCDSLTASPITVLTGYSDNFPCSYHYNV